MSTDDSFVIKDIHNRLEALIGMWDKVKYVLIIGVYG